MKRRSILKAIAGASLSTALPLSALIARTAMAAGTRPIRTLFIYHPDGCSPSTWHPAAGTNPVLPAQSKPLESVKQYCTFLDGFSLAGIGGTHEGGSVKVLTANDMTDAQGSLTSSIEVALGLQSPTLFKSLQIGCLSQYWTGKTISFNGTTRLPYEDNPISAIKTLFSNSGSNTGANANADQLRILDNVSKDLARLRSQLGSLEKERLDQHAAAFESLQNRITTLGLQSSGSGGACPAGSTINTRGLATGDALNVNKMLELSQVQQDITIQALACDLVRNVSFMYSHPVSPLIVPGYNLGDHDASHGTVADFTPSKVWWITQIADFIKKLSLVKESDGSSLLDNTIVLLVSELGDSSLHDHWRVPFVLAGGANTGLKGNRALDFRNPNGYTGASHADLLTLIAQKAGYNMPAFGKATGPQAGIW